MKRGSTHQCYAMLAILASCVLCPTALGQVSLLGVQYQQDRAFPEHECFWRESQYPGPCGASVLGANVHLYLRNEGSSSLTVSDVTLAGLSLKTCLKERIDATKRHAYSIYFASLSSAQLQTLIDAGEPVWYKADPASIPPGGTGQVVVRLRYIPATPTITIGIVSSQGTIATTVPTTADVPAVASVGFSPDRTKTYIYWRRGGRSAPPTTILMDGVNVTANAVTVSDPAVGMAVSVLQPAAPPAAMSYHVYQGVYADGQTATAGLRTWVNDFVYGTWGGRAAPDDDLVAARAWIDDAYNHCVNSLVVTIGSAALGDLFKTVSGHQYAADHDYGFVIDEIGRWAAEHPRMWFIRDEPDAADSRVGSLPAGHNVGVLAMSCIKRGEELRAADPAAPTTVNIDGTYKPYNWYNYGQLPDVFMSDPYYQVRMREAYWTYPERIPLYQKATYIYAVGQLTQSSSEPNPSHLILYSCEWKDDSGAVFPFPTPEAKRIEVYYALAAGIKGLAYWWFPAGRPSNGLSAGTPGALALWKEIGVLGAEIRAAAPLLVTACPASVPMTPSSGLWARSLLVGNDTVVLIVVNNQYWNYEEGCTYIPVTNASVDVTLPSWLASASAFEIAATGVADVDATQNGGRLTLDLGTVNLTRMIVLTSNPQLRASYEQRYDQLVRDRICAVAPELCTQSTLPRITQQPLPQTVCTSATTTLRIVATSPTTMTYQWQKNGANLSNGGHYSGVTTDTLTLSGASTADAADYRCVVTNDSGYATSNAATLTVLACNPNCLQNLGFEGGFTAGAGTGWTKFAKAGSEGANLSFSDETVEKHGGAHCQEIYSHDVGNDGGVYQRFSATPGQAYTVKTWFKVYSPQGSGIAEGFLGIDPTGGTNPNSVSIIWSSKPYEYWSQKSWTITAQASYITVYLRGRSTKAASLNKTAYVWIDDIEVTPASPADGTPQALSTTSIRWRWADSASETGYRVRDSAGADKSGLLPADTIQWVESAGILANTAYTRRICAINDCGESDPSAGQTRYSQIETPVDVAIGTTTAAGIVASPVGTFSNLATGSSGIRVSNTTTGTDSGWQTAATPWASSGLAANTPYTFVARARNAEGVETPDCDAVTAWTLSTPPSSGGILPGNPTPRVNQGVEWTAVGGFGPGTIAHYRYAWDQSLTHDWTGAEPTWAGGTLATTPTAAGTWYLHVQGCNGDDAANGTHDFAVTAAGVASDFDGDGDVDGADYGVFAGCFNGTGNPIASGCQIVDLNNDQSVDGIDFAYFASCFNATGNPPACQ